MTQKTLSPRPELGRRIGTIAADRVAGLPSWLVVTQIFIGLGWLRALAEKLIDPNWFSGESIRDFVIEQQTNTLSWYQPFLDAVVVPAAPVVAITVVTGQLVAGASLITGRHLRFGLAIGILLNLNFLAAGAVSPSIFYVLAQGSIALWMVEQRTSSRSRARLERVAKVSTLLSGFNLPFIRALHPAEVVDDPAVMFTLGGILTALACHRAMIPAMSPGGSNDSFAPPR